MGIEKLHGLVRKWRGRAKNKFRNAESEKDNMGKRLIEHGAICYANSATELEAVLAVFEARTSRTLKAKIQSMRPRAL